MSLQTEIIQELGVKPIINPQEEIEKSITLLTDYVKKNSFLKSFVLGISGGQDSTLAGRLAQLASERLQKEGYEFKFIALRLPYGVQQDEEDAKKAMAFIAADEEYVINIKPAVEGVVNSLPTDLVMSDFNKGNVKARERMVVQYAVAGANQGAVIGTDHAAENITGFFTKFGDGAADIMPLYRLNKRQGKAMLKVLGAPSELYEKVPTADLEEEKPLIPDEVALGVSYEEIDDYLEGKQVSKKAQDVIENWYLKTQHKRHLPITVFDQFWR